MRLNVRECDMDDLPPEVEAAVTNDPEPMGVAYRTGLHYPALRARAIETATYYSRPLSYKFVEKLLVCETDPERVDQDTIRALKEGIPYMAVDWLEMVHMEAQFYGPEPRAIEEALGGEIPLQAVVATLQLLEERGRMPVDEL